jgi:hypothetical protein
LAAAAIAVGAMAATATVATAQQSRAASGPTISGFKATPPTLKSGGGDVRLTALTTGATKCEITSGSTIKGLPTTIPCPGGHPGITVAVPANSGSSVQSISFQMKAEASNGAYAEEGLFVHVLPRAAAVTSFTSNLATVPSSGGKVILSGKVVRANLCVISVNPAVTGLPAEVTCSTGSLTKTVTLPAATSGTSAQYDFALSAAGPGGAAPSAQVAVTVTGKAPTISSFTATPSTLPSGGGTVTLSITVADANECGFGYSWSGGSNPIGSSLPHDMSCTSGTYTYKVPFAADTTKSPNVVTFNMTKVTSGGGSAVPTSSPVVTEAAS